jgi:hypothetical protein
VTHLFVLFLFCFVMHLFFFVFFCDALVCIVGRHQFEHTVHSMCSMLGLSPSLRCTAITLR